MPGQPRSWRCRECALCAPCGISFASVAAWRQPLIPSRRLCRVPARPTSIAFGHFLVLRHRIVLHDLTFEDPDLHAAGTVGSECGSDAVIDVGAERVQWHPALAIPFHARDFGAAKPAGAVDADAAGAKPHCRLHGTLHGAAEGDAALELLRNGFGDKLLIELRLANFDNINNHVAVGELGDLAAQLLD